MSVEMNDYYFQGFFFLIYVMVLHITFLKNSLQSFLLYGNIKLHRCYEFREISLQFECNKFVIERTKRSFKREIDPMVRVNENYIFLSSNLKVYQQHQSTKMSIFLWGSI